MSNDVILNSNVEEVVEDPTMGTEAPLTADIQGEGADIQISEEENTEEVLPEEEAAVGEDVAGEAATEGMDAPGFTEDGEEVYAEEAPAEDMDVTGIDGEVPEDGFFEGDVQDDFYGEDGYYEEMMEVDGSSGSSFAPMSSWPFLIIMFVVALALGVGGGILLAKRRIKKGIDPYED